MTTYVKECVRIAAEPFIREYVRIAALTTVSTKTPDTVTTEADTTATADNEKAERINKYG